MVFGLPVSGGSGISIVQCNTALSNTVFCQDSIRLEDSAQMLLDDWDRRFESKYGRAESIDFQAVKFTSKDMGKLPY